MAETERIKRHWSSVQILRGFAAILVAIYHFEPHFRVVLHLPPESGPFSWFGWFGVDLFFVTSGFVIWPLIAKSHYKIGDRMRFLVKRALRVYVPYLSVMAVMLYYGLGNPNADIAKSLLLYPQGLDTQYLPVAWTLVCEIVFYVVAFCVMFIPSVTWRYRALAAVTVSPVVHAAMTIVFTEYATTSYYLYWVDRTGSPWLDGSISGHFVSLWFLEFFAGVSISYLLTTGRGAALAARPGTIWLCAAAWFAAAILVSWGAYGGSLNNGELVIQRIVLFGGAGALIFAGALASEMAGALQRIPARVRSTLEWLGNGSYSIYLIHTIVFGLAYTIGFRDWCMNNGALGAAAMIGYFVGTILLSALFGNWAELPVYRWMAGLFDSKGRAVPSR